jgi:hypothetical protein
MPSRLAAICPRPLEHRSHAVALAFVAVRQRHCQDRRRGACAVDRYAGVVSAALDTTATAAMKEGLLAGTRSLSSRSEQKQARLHVARWVGFESSTARRLPGRRERRARRAHRGAARRRWAAPPRGPAARPSSQAVIESMTGARFGTTRWRSFMPEEGLEPRHADYDSGQIRRNHREFRADWTRRWTQPHLQLHGIPRVRGASRARLGLFDEQADEVVARGSTGPSCWLRTTIGASGRTPISSRRIAWRRRRRPVVLSTRAHARIDVSVGEGFARPRSGQSRDVRPWPPVCARCRPRLRSSARAQTARSYVVRSRGESPRLRDDRSSRRAGAPSAVTSRRRRRRVACKAAAHVLGRRRGSI